MPNSSNPMDYRDFTDENTGVGCHFLLHGSSDHELLIAKFKFKLKKVGKTSRPFRYDLNKILMIIQWKRLSGRPDGSVRCIAPGT